MTQCELLVAWLKQGPGMEKAEDEALGKHLTRDYSLGPEMMLGP